MYPVLVSIQASPPRGVNWLVAAATTIADVVEDVSALMTEG
jgi:hypothetical protein